MTQGQGGADASSTMIPIGTGRLKTILQFQCLLPWCELVKPQGITSAICDLRALHYRRSTHALPTHYRRSIDAVQTQYRRTQYRRNFVSSTEPHYRRIIDAVQTHFYKREAVQPHYSSTSNAKKCTIDALQTHYRRNIAAPQTHHRRIIDALQSHVVFYRRCVLKKSCFLKQHYRRFQAHSGILQTHLGKL